MRDHVCEGEAQHREVEEASMPSTSLDHWEAQSVDVHKTAIPVYEEDDDRGLSRTFRISIISGSIVMMIAVILCLVVILPHSSKRHNKGLLEVQGNRNVKLMDGKTSSRGITLACRATRFPKVCESTLNANPVALRALRSQDIIEGAIQVASHGEAQSHRLAQNLLSVSATRNINLTAAARNCEYLLRRASLWFDRCQHTPLRSNVEIKDIQAWMSAALTYENDCHSALLNLQNFVRTRYVKNMIEQIEYVTTLTSNALSMVDAYGTYGEDPSRWKPPNKKSTPLLDASDFRSRLRISDRRLIEKVPIGDLIPSVIVSKDTQGNFTSVQEAVDAAPENASERFIIYIKQGVYNETVRIPYNKAFLMFVGDGMNKTIITGNRNVQMPGITTYDSATLAVDGDGFIARGITVENTAGPDMHQAVALRVDSDLSAFYGCSFMGHQDTLYVHSLRQFYRNCKIEGTIDFIFGNSASVFQNCRILVRPGRLQVGTSTVTAQGRTDPAETTALVFQNCFVNGTQGYMAGFFSDPQEHRAYLGRPWKLYSRTIFITTYIESLISPEGWLPWNETFALDTLFYGEYHNDGPGANISSRVPWCTEISRAQALQFTVSSFIQGDQWLPATNVLFTSIL